MESYNDFFLLNLRNTINTESLKLEKDENMVNHIDMMKEVLLFGLKTLSKYDFTKDKLTPQVRIMINYLEKKNEMQKLKSKRKLLTLKNMLRKTSVRKNKKNKKKKNKSKKSLKKKGGGTGYPFLNVNNDNRVRVLNQSSESNESNINNVNGLNYVRPYNTVFGSELDVESIFI